MKPFVVITDGMDARAFSGIKEDSLFEVHPKSPLTPKELKELLPRANALVIRSATKIDRELIDSAPRLKYIIRAGEGTDHIDKLYCKEKGIAVSNTPGANNNSAAEHALALMMSALRSIPQAHGSMKAYKWEKSRFTGLELWKKRVGIVGFGRIGQIVAKRLRGFETDTLFYDPFVTESPLDFCQKAKTLEEIFSTCDVVTLHTPLMEKTKNMVTASLLGLMGRNAILVNASRGKIVNEDDLYACLKEGRLRAAAFDVFAVEPLPKDSKLMGLDNFIMTPHLGAGTEEAQRRVGQMSVMQLREFFQNDKLLNEVVV
ncbi:MAG: hydroxyacid dehydrogenase [Bacteriovoracales bacterium]|nr:hydroxyacid dehydrogenase [Bacteriovoracales bacterium]